MLVLGAALGGAARPWPPARRIPRHQRPGIPRDAGTQRHAGARLLSRGPPGRRRHHPERAARRDERRPAPRADPGPVGADASGGQAAGRPRGAGDQRPHGLSRLQQGPKGLQPHRLSRFEARLLGQDPARGAAFRIIVDLDAPLPAEWVGKVGFNLELFPGILFGKSYEIGGQFGSFPRQANGPGAVTDGDYEVAPLGSRPEADRRA